MRSRAVSLPRDRWRSTEALAAAGSDLRGPRAELLDERGHPLVAARERVGVALDLRGQEHGSGAYRSCK